MSGTELKLELGGSGPRTVRIDALVIAGWTGRDKTAMEAHIAELEALGVERPPRTPMFYRVAASLLTTDDSIDVTGAESSGEVETVILAQADGLWVGVGSDHTDRAAEAIDVTLSKQLCAKPVGTTFWRFDEVHDHWDQLVLKSYAVSGGQEELYQEGSVANMLLPEDLIEQRGGLAPGTAMFGGTLAVHGGVRPSDGLALRLEDPVRGRVITHRYDVRVLPGAA